MLLCVNYHYFREQSLNRGIFPTRKEQLSKQIDLLGQSFRFVGLSELSDLDFSQGNYCLLTFDDGLREQFDVAYDVMKSKGVPGAFFVSPSVYQSDAILFVHQLHYLLETIEITEFGNSLMNHISKGEYKVPENLIEKARQQYRYDSEDTAICKYILNFTLQRDQQESFINELFRKTVSNSKKLKDDLYMTQHQIRILAENGMLGSHGYSHIALGQCDLDIQKKEIEYSRSLLKNIGKKSVEAISYPFGGPTAVDREIAELALGKGYVVGLTMERAANLTSADMLLLGRFDTNDVPGGRQPLFSSAEDISAKGLYRKRYLVERNGNR